MAEGASQEVPYGLMKMAGTFTIPPLISGGVMLSYRCTNECRHCLYRCSPRQPDEWMTLDMAGRVFGALAPDKEPSLRDVHLAGGEPTIRMDLLVEIVRLAVAAGVRLSYVETNAHWCTDREKTERTMRRLKEAGLPGVLVSVSMFHNEFVPFRNTRNCVEAAREVFGLGRTYLYLPHMYDILSQMPDDGRHSLEEFSRWAELDGRPEMIAALYQVIPNGRACTALRDCYAARDARSFRGRNCLGDLTSTTHFHVDHNGDLFTGLCAGLAPATIDELHPEITEGTHPVFCRLATAGPYGLMEMAAGEYGFREREAGYVSRCDLCMDVRGSLHGTGAFPELRPASFYDA
jgi:hypothetical protein